MKLWLAAAAVIAMSINTASAQSSALKVTDHLTVPQWVNPATPGELRGRVILPSTDGSSRPIANAKVAMSDQEGMSLTATADEAGNFLMKGVEPGLYALTARADGAFACCAMHVVDQDMASADVLPREVEVAAAAIDYTIVKSSILRYLPPFSKDQPYSMQGADLASISSQVVGDNLFRVKQTAGGLKGRILVAGAQGKQLGDAGLLNIFLVAKGDVVDRVVSNGDGSFEFANVSPGEYSILALGQAGLGMAGFELVDEAVAEANSSNARVGLDGRTLVGNYDPCCCCETFSMQIAPLPLAISACEVITTEEVIASEEIPMEEGFVNQDGVMLDEFGNPIATDQFGNPIGSGGAAGGAPAGGGYSGGGGGFSGGGGGGFGGGLGGLAGLAALAAIGSDDDSNILDTPVPASPAR
ncbi:carboxypeptidase regulatory-like domain-containing protein [Neorhodopirellula lusitana]|uniref:carboxypeptidase regulatory-like domain-containing protein n=1 Tax=Neorhodopirellula lusitana TaxID=445327 RepID=UPI00384ABD7F